jgi:hypothetical protein
MLMAKVKDSKRESIARAAPQHILLNIGESAILASHGGRASPGGCANCAGITAPEWYSICIVSIPWALARVGMDFEYDPAKSDENKRKHGIDFEDAQAL